jgi:multiple sugar transport system substrate-binding protein
MFYIWYYTINRLMENNNQQFQNPSLVNPQASSQGEVPAPDFLQPPQNYSQNIPNQTPRQQSQLPVQQNLTQNYTYHDGSNGGFAKFKKIFSVLATILLILGAIFIIVNFILPNLNKAPSQNIVTLTYWGLFKDPGVMRGVISDFERQNPNIKIDYTQQDINQYKDRLVTRIANGTGPDIFRFHNTWYLMLKNYLLPLPSQTISQDEFSAVFYPVMQKDLIKNGAIYGIPLEIDTLSLFINTQLFQAAGVSAPNTWVDFVNDAKAITVKNADGTIKTAGAAMGTYNNITHAPDIMSLLFLENGVDLNNLQASADRISGALTFYTSFANGNGATWDNTLDPSQLAFAKGNLGMFFGYSRDYFAIKKYNPKLSFQIVPVPQLPNQNVTFASYWVEGVSAKSTHQKEAFLFMKFLAKKETEQKLFEAESKVREFGEPFARVDLAETLKNNTYAYPFVLQAQNATSAPFVDGTYDNGLNQQLNANLSDVINAYLQGSGSDSDTVQGFITNVTKTLQQYAQ